jgi:Uncharacterized protein conserved in bacteria
MDEQPFIGIKSKEYDVFIIYDYSVFEDFTNIKQEILKYSQICLIAWSMGVWAAERCLENESICFTKAIAINGTLKPINDVEGIPESIYNGTIKNLPEVLPKFNLRMCGGKNGLEYYLERCSKRNALEIKEELIKIKELFLQENSTNHNSVKWDYSIISLKDNIFPTNNQLTFWERYKRAKIIKIDSYHYPFKLLNNWEKIIELCTLK